MASSRGREFKEINVANFSSQRPVDRYPDMDNAAINVPDDIEDDDFELPDGPPPFARWRCNLTALSIKYNLYFVAVRDKIHITVPRNLKQIIPGQPDLVLNLPRSFSAHALGGYIDEARPHCVNHMVIGDLGCFEVLLLACDDGDVLVYYTHLLYGEIKHREDSSRSSIEPLFHENVGSSAWGLAVHAESRLIAVSSNLKQISIFAFGRTGSENANMPYKLKYPRKFLNLGRLERDNMYSCRIVIPLDGDNIPSIDFASGKDGETHSILAVDIRGTLYILGIWDTHRHKIPSIYNTGEPTPLRSSRMGWGVIAIPLNMCKKTSGPDDAFGIRKAELKENLFAAFLGQKLETYFDISNTIRLVKDSSISHPSMPQLETSPSDNSEPSSPSVLVLEDENQVMHTLVIRNPTGISLEALRQRREAQRKEESENDLLRFEYMVNCSPQWLIPGQSGDNQELAQAFLDHKKGLKPQYQEYKKEPEYILPEYCAILRIYAVDIELIPPADSMPRTLCKQFAKQQLPDGLRQLLMPYERLCFNASIPELSLVVVASQIGRAALITITRPNDSFSRIGPVVTFRIEAFLPLAQHESEKQGHRPISPLLGIAVAPVQGEVHAPYHRRQRRWRLLLHYYNSTILSYELSRDENNDLLVL